MSDRTKTVADHFDDTDEFDKLLGLAWAGAETEWEIEFVGDIKSRFNEWGEKMFLSPRQLEVIQKLADAAGDDEPEAPF